MDDHTSDLLGDGCYHHCNDIFKPCMPVATIQKAWRSFFPFPTPFSFLSGRDGFKSKSASRCPCSPNSALWENFVKQKFKNAPDLVGAGQVRSGRGPLPGVWQPIQVQGEGLLPWSLGRLVPNLACLLPTWGHGHRDVLYQLDPNHLCGGGQRVLLVCTAQTMRLWKTQIEQKLLGAPDLVGQVKSDAEPHWRVGRPVQVQRAGLLQWCLG